mmetsp:Transcript_8436/g.23384  ORF Transcript_8436/g.23384 Transcript_8436/m.23384 type:complete len:220 (+) Transcript_8436:581-1240(+)
MLVKRPPARTKPKTRSAPCTASGRRRKFSRRSKRVGHRRRGDMESQRKKRKTKKKRKTTKLPPTTLNRNQCQLTTIRRNPPNMGMKYRTCLPRRRPPLRSKPSRTTILPLRTRTTTTTKWKKKKKVKKSRTDKNHCHHPPRIPVLSTTIPTTIHHHHLLPVPNRPCRLTYPPRYHRRCRRRPRWSLHPNRRVVGLVVATTKTRLPTRTFPRPKWRTRRN